MIGLRPDENVQRPQIVQNKTYLIDPEDSGGDACSEGGGQVVQTLFQLCFHSFIYHYITCLSNLFVLFVPLFVLYAISTFFYAVYISFWGFQGGCDLSWCSYTPKLTEFQVRQPFYHDSFVSKKYAIMTKFQTTNTGTILD